MEQRWEEALREQQRLEEEYACFQQTQPARLTEAELDLIRSLSKSIPDLWNDPRTSAADRKTVIRHLIERLVVAVREETEFVDVAIHWVGGHVSNHEFRRPVRGYDQLRDYARLKRRIEELAGMGNLPWEIAAQINSEGFRPPNRQPQFSGRMVSRFLRENCRRGSGPYKLADLAKRGPEEWLLKDLARELGIAEQTLHAWRRKGWVKGRQIAGPQSHWLLWADSRELDRLRRLSQMPSGSRPYPAELKTPIGQ